MKPMPHKTRLITLAVAVATVTAAATTLQSRNQQTRGGPATTKGLVARQNAQAGTIIVTRAGSTAAVVTQNAPPDARPFLHPIAAPDGRGVLTESSPDAPSAPDRALLGLHAPERARLLPQSRRRLLAPRLRDRPAGVGRRGALADGLRPPRRERRGDPHRDRALVDARAERPLPARPDLARRSAARRHHRQVRLRRPVPPHAVAAGHRRRGRQRRPPAQRARGRPARHVGRRRDAGRGPRRSRAHRDLRPSRQRRLSAAVARGRSARRRHRARARRRLVHPGQPDRSHPPPLRRLHRHAGRRRDDQCVDGVQRQPVDVFDRRAVGHRAAGRARRDVPLAAGGRGEHDDGPGLRRSTRGPASRW